MRKTTREDFIRPSLLDNITGRQLIVDWVAHDPIVFKSLPENIRNDSAICLDIAAKNPQAFNMFSYHLRDDDKIVEACFGADKTKVNASFWASVSGRLRQRKWIRDLAFAWSPYVFEHFTEAQLKNDKLGRKAFAHDHSMFFSLSEKLQNDLHIVLKLLERGEFTMADLKRRKVSTSIVESVGENEPIPFIRKMILEASLPNKDKQPVSKI
jgi:hypothetical protein